MESCEIIATSERNSAFENLVDFLRRTGVRARQIRIADYDREQGHNLNPHPRGDEVYVLVPTNQLERALSILKMTGESAWDKAND